MSKVATGNVATKEEDYEAIIGFLVHLISWYGGHTHIRDVEEKDTWKIIEKKYKPISDQWRKDKLRKLFKNGAH